MKQPFIQNVPAYSIASGNHRAVGHDSVLIQIMDPCSEFPIPKADFQIIYQYRFLDIEEGMDGFEDFGVTLSHAASIAEALRHAYANKLDVIVHCHMGVCRSGAVAEVGVEMGFQDTGDFRSPNVTVKKFLRDYLGFTTTQNTSAFNS